MDCDVLVVGGGITGCSAAWTLVGLGADVILLEEFDLNTQASGRNAGSLHGQIQYPSFAERGEAWARGFLPSLRLLVDSLEIWKGLDKELGADLEVSLAGGVLIGANASHMEIIERKVNIELQVGVESHLLSPEDLRSIAPYTSPNMAGAQLCIVEGKANPLLAAPAFASAARRRGARVFTNAPVSDIHWEEGGFTAHSSAGLFKARRVVLAAGGGLNRFSALWGNPLPLQISPVQVGVTEPIAPLIDHLIYFTGGQLTLKQAKAGTVLIGGGWPADIDARTGQPRVNPWSLSGNMSVALEVVPALAQARLIRTWAGSGVDTPDLAPIIDRIGPPGLVVGLYPHLGLTAGPLVGRLLAQLALDVAPDLDVRPFSVNRW